MNDTKMRRKSAVANEVISRLVVIISLFLKF
jgi:hypothetical protein